MTVYRYRPAILAELARRGIVPNAGTPPQPLRDLVSALYVFEIRDRKLRHREMERILGPQTLDAYRDAIRKLKLKYQPLLGLPAELWVEPAGS